MHDTLQTSDRRCHTTRTRHGVQSSLGGVVGYSFRPLYVARMNARPIVRFFDWLIVALKTDRLINE